MVCRSGGGLREQLPSPAWGNWAEEISYTPARTFQPRSVDDVVAAVQAAETDGRRIKAYGTGWSFSDASVTSSTDYLLDTCGLFQILGAFGPGIVSDERDGPAIVPGALRNSVFRDGERRLVHVEAGIKVHNLNDALQRRGCAMPTLGGSAGQSLAGVISTGTHGGDLDLGLIGDAIKAIHIVGAGGQEWWIEGSGDNRITQRGRLLSRLDCDDINIEYDDDFLRAAVISLGRFGIIYSVVLEVEASFFLHEVAGKELWDLRLPGLFTPGIRLPGFTLVREQLETGAMFTDTGTLPDGEDLHFLQILHHPFNPSGCHVTRRSKLSTATPRGNPGDDLFNMLCRQRDVSAVIQRLLEQLSRLRPDPDVGTKVLIGIAAFFGLGPLLGPLFDVVLVTAGSLAAILTSVFGVAAAVATPLAAELIRLSEGGRATLGELIARVVNRLAEAGFPDLAQDLLVSLFEQTQGDADRIDVSFRIMDGYGRSTGYGNSTDPCVGPGVDQCYKVSSYEFFFDADSTEYLDFIDAVSSAARRISRGGSPLAFLFAMRFMRRSDALLSPARFGRTCAVEIPIVQGLVGNRRLRRDIERIASRFLRRPVPQAIPSWGQHYFLPRGDVERIYGADLDLWRSYLRRISPPDAANTFSTEFSVVRGLEYDLPSPRCFIATAAIGDPEAPEVQILRDFRDRSLRPTWAGRRLVALYEFASPPVARQIARNEFARKMVRFGLVRPLARLMGRVTRRP